MSNKFTSSLLFFFFYRHYFDSKTLETNLFFSHDFFSSTYFNTTYFNPHVITPASYRDNRDPFIVLYKLSVNATETVWHYSYELPVTATENERSSISTFNSLLNYYRCFFWEWCDSYVGKITLERRQLKWKKKIDSTFIFNQINKNES